MHSYDYVSFLFYLFYFSNCRNNKPLFKAGPFDEAFNISDKLDIEKVNLTVLHCVQGLGLSEVAQNNNYNNCKMLIDQELKK